MKKVLYYVVEKEISSDGESLNGLKTITVYEINNNQPDLFASIDCSVEDLSSEIIQGYLTDNGYGDDKFVFKQL